MPEQISSLTCPEKLDVHATSPRLFHEEPLPGVWDFNRENISILSTAEPGKSNIRADLDQNDVSLVTGEFRGERWRPSELGKLSPEQLLEYIQNLQNNAFVLGVEEARQFAKAKVLQIFRKRGNEG